MAPEDQFLPKEESPIKVECTSPDVFTQESDDESVKSLATAMETSTVKGESSDEGDNYCHSLPGSLSPDRGYQLDSEEEEEEEENTDEQPPEKKKKQVIKRPQKKKM